MSELREAGQPFNPWRGACGFYPPDVVGRQRQRDLGDGPKRLYEFLVRRSGKKGYCFWSQKEIAIQLGKSRQQIHDDVCTLERCGLIEHRRGGKDTPNRYTFRWHDMFDQRLDEDANGEEIVSTPPDTIAEKIVSTPDRIVSTFGPDSVKPTGQELSNNHLESSSSAKTETTTIVISENKVEKTWAEEEITEAKKLLKEHLGNNTSPDERLVRSILQDCISVKHLADCLAELPRTGHGWGFYLTSLPPRLKDRRDAMEAEAKAKAEHEAKCNGVAFTATLREIGGERRRVLYGSWCYACDKAVRLHGAWKKTDCFRPSWGPEWNAQQKLLQPLIEAEAQRRGDGWLTEKQANSLEWEMRGKHA